MLPYTFIQLQVSGLLAEEIIIRAKSIDSYFSIQVVAESAAARTAADLGGPGHPSQSAVHSVQVAAHPGTPLHPQQVGALL